MTSTLETIPIYRRLHALYAEAAARAVTESDRDRWEDRKNQLYALSDEVEPRDPGALISARRLLESESRRMSHYIALQIADRLR